MHEVSKPAAENEKNGQNGSVLSTALYAKRILKVLINRQPLTRGHDENPSRVAIALLD